MNGLNAKMQASMDKMTVAVGVSYAVATAEDAIDWYVPITIPKHIAEFLDNIKEDSSNAGHDGVQGLSGFLGLVLEKGFKSLNREIMKDPQRAQEAIKSLQEVCRND